MSVENYVDRLSAYLADRAIYTNEGVLSDCIIDDSPLGFERSFDERQNVEIEDPLEEVNLGTETEKRPIFVSSFLPKEFKVQLVELIREYKDCFAWNYNEMPGLSRDLVEHRLPLKEGCKPVKQANRRFAPEVVLKIKEEVERLLKAKFIRTTRYVE